MLTEDELDELDSYGEDVRSAVRELRELRGNAALMNFAQLMGMEPVRPDVHAKVLRQRNRLKDMLRECITIAKKNRTWKFQLGPNTWERVNLGPDLNDSIRLDNIVAEIDTYE